MDDGTVQKDIVLYVLRENGVSVSEAADGSAAVLVKGSVVEVQLLPEKVPRYMVQRLGHKFDVPRHYFWHPDMMPRGDDDSTEEGSAGPLISN